MSTRIVEEIDEWPSEPFGGGYARLRELADGAFSGVVRSGTATLCFLNGTAVGVLGGTIEDFEGADGTVSEAPSPALPLLALMQERNDEVRAKYYTEDTPISEVDSTLSDGGFSGYIELSENVLSGDYYVVYHGGRSMSVAYVGNSGQLLTDDEAFERADGEVGIYKVRPADVDPVEIPGPAGSTGGAAGTATEPDSRDVDAGDSSAAATDGSAGRETDDAVGTSSPRGADPTPATETDRAPRGAGTDESTPPGGAATDAGTSTAESTDASEWRTPAGADEASAAGEDPPPRSEDAGNGSGTSAGSPPSGGSDTSEPGGEGRSTDRARSPGSTDGSSGRTTGEGGTERSTGEPGVDRGRSEATADRAQTGTSSSGRPDRESAPAGSDAGSASPRDTAEPQPRAGDHDADREASAGRTSPQPSEPERPGGSAGGTERDAAGREESGEPAGGERREPGAVEATDRPADDPGETTPATLERRSVPSLDPARSRSDDPTGGAVESPPDDAVDEVSSPGTGEGEASAPEPGGAGDATPEPAGDPGSTADGTQGTADERPPSAETPTETTAESAERHDAGREAGRGQPNDTGTAAGDANPREASTTGRADGAAAGNATTDRQEEHSDRDGASQREGERERLAEKLADVEAERDDLRAQRDSLQERLDGLAAERDHLVEERDQLVAERDDLQAEVADLESELERLRDEVDRLEETYGVSSESDHRLAPTEALDGTNLFVRYGSKSEATLEAAHDGDASREAVTENLGLEYHTQFEAEGATVAGEPFETFLYDTIQYRFVSWVVEDLLYEIRETGKRAALEDLYDAIPRIDRAELNGVVTTEYVEDGQKQRGQESFDVVLRDRMGNALVVANLHDSREAATESMMNSLVTAASRVRESTDSLAAACLVTSSFFEPEALETASEATSGGLLSRDKRASFVKLSRKRGYHLCLSEARDGKFHLAVPEL